MLMAYQMCTKQSHSHSYTQSAFQMVESSQNAIIFSLSSRIWNISYLRYESPFWFSLLYCVDRPIKWEQISLSKQFEELKQRIHDEQEQLKQTMNSTSTASTINDRKWWWCM